MNLEYGYLSWTRNSDEEDFLKDTRDINALLKQLSPEAPEMHISDIMTTNNLGFLAIARDLDNVGRIVGMATMIEKRQLTGRFGTIEDVVVDVAYRGQGIAERLNLQLIEEARKRKLVHLDLTSSPARVAANKLYLKLGYEKRETNVYRKKLS